MDWKLVLHGKSNQLDVGWNENSWKSSEMTITKEFQRNLIDSKEPTMDFSPSQIDVKCVKICLEMFIWSLGTKKFCVESWKNKLFLGWNLDSKFKYTFKIHKNCQKDHFFLWKIVDFYCSILMQFSPLFWCVFPYGMCFGDDFSPP